MYKHKNGITLRKMERSDLPALKDLKSESWFGTHTIAILNTEEQEAWYESMIGHPKHMIMIALITNDLGDPGSIKITQRVGVYKISNLDYMNSRYDSAYDVFEEYRGKGLGKKVAEAGVDFGFEVLNMNRADTEVLSNNDASKKCTIFAGFTLEGVKRRCVRKCDEWLSSNFYGLLRDEWRELDRVKAYEGVCNETYKPKTDTIDNGPPYRGCN